MRFLTTIFAVLMSLSLSWSALACEGAGANKHVGMVTQVDAGKKTFTIKDAETQKPITFSANEAIISGLKGYSGKVLVSYEENAEGLKATGVTF